MRLRGFPLLPIGHPWLRVAARDWDDPLDPTFAQRLGGRRNPPDSWPTLYLNRTAEAARAQIARLRRGTPFGGGNLADDAFDLVSVFLSPADVVDCMTDEGLAAAGLPSTYPADDIGRRPRSPPRSIGAGLVGRWGACGAGRSAASCASASHP